MPIAWGANQSGMQATSNLGRKRSWVASKLWRTAGKLACIVHLALEKVGLHKQIANRILEPWQIMKVVVTSTEWENFLWLRNHSDAQPEIAKLAECLDLALQNSEPRTLAIGDWHLPYAKPIKCTGEFGLAELENAKAVSASCCAQVSYNRELNTTPERALKIYDMLISGQRVHASPFEHQATPMHANMYLDATVVESLKENGITHVDTNGDYWSGNFKGWIQHRQLIKGHVKW